LSKSFHLGDYKTEIEAAQAYNIGAIIIDGEDAEFNDVPTPSIETFNRVMLLLQRQGWVYTQKEMRIIKNLCRIYLGMDFRADA
jgi:hypothetical protein